MTTPHKKIGIQFDRDLYCELAENNLYDNLWKFLYKELTKDLNIELDVFSGINKELIDCINL
jgi:hypothetical protein